MKLKRTLSILLSLVMMLGMLPFAAFSDSRGVVQSYSSYYFTVNEGESIAVWETDVASSNKSNYINVEITDDASYDIVFPEDDDTLAALAFYQYGINNWSTHDLFVPDATANKGMLLWISVNSGSARISVRTTSETLFPYVADSSPLDYYQVTEGQSASFQQSLDCNISNLSLVTFGTLGSEIKRTAVEGDCNYELYRFTREEILIDSYVDGAKSDTLAVPYTSVIAVDDTLFHCARVIFPGNDTVRDAGVLKVTSGEVIIAAPVIPEFDETNKTDWMPAGDSDAYEAPVKYSPAKEDLMMDTNGALPTGTLYTSPADLEKLPGNLSTSPSLTTEELRNKVVVADVGSSVANVIKPGNQSASALNGKIGNVTKPLDKTTEHVMVVGSFSPNYELNIIHSDVIHYPGWTSELLQLYRFASNDKVTVRDPKTGKTYEVRRDSLSRSSSYTNYYSIHVVDGTASSDRVKEGEQVSVSANVPESMVFKNWTSNADFSFPADSQSFQTGYLNGDVYDITFTAHFEPISYSISASAGEGGSVITSEGSAPSGETVGVTLSPDPGYAVASVTAYADGDIALTPGENAPDSYTFTMPAKAVTVSATFAKVSYDVTTSAEYGTLTADKQTATVGETVTLSVAPEDAQYSFGSLSVRCGDSDVTVTKTGDSTYTFVMPAGSVTATAVFVRNHIVRFENWNGVLLGWCDLPAGQTPVYSGETPVREPDETCVYTFVGWGRELAPVSGDETYTATFTPSARNYTVTFVDADGNVLQSSEVPYDEMPEYTGATPTKATDENYVYSFFSWWPGVVPVTGDMTYEPSFSTVPLLHTGRNALDFGEWEVKVCPFVPQESGYYRFWTVGEISPECIITDVAGSVMNERPRYVDYSNCLSYETIANLTAGTEYKMTAETYSTAGSIALYIEKVDLYTVSVDQDTVNGTVECQGGVTFLAYSGEMLIPVAKPAEGYGLLDLIVTDSNGRRVIGDDGQYVMPNSDINISAVFGQAHTLDINTGPDIGCSTNEAVYDDWSGGSMTSRAAAGSGVEITLSWADRYILNNFALKTASGEDVPFSCSAQYLNALEIWFSMPDEAVSLTLDVIPGLELLIDPGEVNCASLNLFAYEGAQIELPDCPFELPDEKTFAGWSVTVGNGDAVLMAPGEKVTMTADAKATATYTEAVGARFAGHELVLTGSIGVCFKMVLSDEIDYSGSYMEMNANGRIQRMGYESARTDTETGKRVFTYFASTIEIAEDVVPTFHYFVGGVEETVTGDAFSVQNYIDYVLDPANISEFDADVISLVSAIADYGYYSQQYCSGVNNWTIGSDYAEVTAITTGGFESEFTPVYNALGSTYDIVKNLSGTKVTDVKFALKLGSETAISLRIEMESGSEAPAVTYKGASLGVNKVAEDVYQVCLGEVTASQLGSMSTVMINDGTSYAEVTLSALSYVRAVLDPERNFPAAQKNAVVALYNYYSAVKNYLGD